jgi:mycothiol synthase
MDWLMPNFIIRHYLPEKELLLLSKMLTEIEAIDRDGEDTSVEYLRNALTWHNYRPDQDVWVAELEGELVGYAAALEQPSQHCTIYAVVHPSQRHKGLGSQLISITLNRAREFKSHDILVYANERNEAANLFLKQHQFQRVGSSGVMKAPATIEIPPYEFPEGFTLQRYAEVNEPRVLLEALNICYLGMWGHQHSDKRSEEELRSPRFLKYYDAEDILLLFDRTDSIVGICSVKSGARKDEGGKIADLLDAPGIIKEYREQGYQRPLVLTAIQHLRWKGTRPIMFEFWGDGESALKIYHELGFEMDHHYLAYHKELI